jgi:hypothetical protein
MADEAPEQIRERVHAEELAKGSDPRVAEGRAKAAELRAKAGLPIEPDKAWRAKLEQEGGEAPAAAPAAGTATAEEPAEEAEPREEEAPAPAAAEEAPEPSAPAEAPAAAAPVVTLEPEFVLASAAPREVEVGQPIEVDAEGLKVVAGVPIRSDPLPFWVTGILLVVVLWAVAYALFLSGPEAIQKTTRCRVSSDKILVCATRPTPSP